MLAKETLDAQVVIQLPARELLAVGIAGRTGPSPWIGDILRLFLLPFVPTPMPIIAPYIYS